MPVGIRMQGTAVGLGAVALYATLVAVVAAGSCTDRKRVAIAEVVARRWPSPGRRLALRLFPVAIWL